MKASKPRSNKTGEIGVFANKLRCKNCGGSMRSWINKHQKYYRCSTTQFARNRCSQGAYISHSVLERTVLDRIQKLFNRFVDDKEVSKRINISNGLQSTRKHLCDCVKRSEKELADYQHKFKQLYMDRLDEVVSVEEYKIIYSELNANKQRLSDLVLFYNKEISEIDKKLSEEIKVDTLIENFKNIKKIDRIIVNTLIDYIEVGGTKNDRILVIHWNF